MALHTGSFVDDITRPLMVVSRVADSAKLTFVVSCAARTVTRWPCAGLVVPGKYVVAKPSTSVSSSCPGIIIIGDRRTPMT